MPAERRHRLYPMLLSFAGLIVLTVLLGMPVAFPELPI